ncbi:hypothetical protein TorRG33x02_186220 [Trema orientale]|uniref:Uncharacterized protein n=1 Tax=Trema orientale TaxID=63057 RepID=A0A2P5EJ93_TREOI|nr:hypothetical protein TorRG33x02_186220 [Trema orientale]
MANIFMEQPTIKAWPQFSPSNNGSLIQSKAQHAKNKGAVSDRFNDLSIAVEIDDDDDFSRSDVLHHWKREREKEREELTPLSVEIIGIRKIKINIRVLMPMPTPETVTMENDRPGEQKSDK